ncbi:FAD-dependent monooxygenase [Dactylosporangium salmoneum]|uniref:FAD-dependent monooxygenase n=1 Tax=Dactylosporangium salmoneum TaxID=53361 RepID=A0ABP5SKT3_9ACTN
MEQTQVVVAGGGPTGLMLACELRLAGLDVVVLDAAAGRSGESRAGGLHARSLEILEHRGIAERFLARGRRVPAAHFAGIWLELSGLGTRYTFVLGLVQARVEELLEERAAELGARVRWSSPVTGLTQTASHAEVTTAGGEVIRAQYVVGCDGGRSTIRRLAGIAFEGTDATLSSMLADVELADPPAGPIFQRRTPLGDFTVLPLQPGSHRLMVNQYDRVAPRDAVLDFAGFREAFVAISGRDFGMHSPRWVSRYNDAARLAAAYRAGRVLLAGDAAHIHWPAGGQGLNTGLQDAANLGWKLGLVARGLAGDALLDTYEAERRPVAARVLDNTRAQTALSRPGAQVDALRATMSGLLSVEDANRRLAEMIVGLDQGERAADVALATAGPMLFGTAESLATAEPWSDRVDLAPAGGRERLIRPDGYVAWSGGEGLREALASWFGPASSSALSRA